jgi:hypothetical protein
VSKGWAVLFSSPYHYLLEICGVPASARCSSSGWSECVSGALPEREYAGPLQHQRRAGNGRAGLQRTALGAEGIKGLINKPLHGFNQSLKLA